jgi:two-component system alkaline phosphatase synthesis response regulator PhoP
MTILIIDDNPSMHFIMRTALEFRGYDVISARDGIEGLKIAREKQPDLIILDFVIPKLTGFHLCKMLRESKETSSTPILLVSSKADKVGDKFIQMFNITDYLQKPFTTDALVKKVESILNKTTTETKPLPQQDHPL